MMKRALFIGRFQPFHTGHSSVLRDAKRSGYDEVIIGIGSSQYSRVTDNPFTYEERVQIIEASTKNDSSLPVTHIIALPDIHDDANWVSHVNAIIAKNGLTYDVVFTGNSTVRELFSNAQVPIQSVQQTIHIAGTMIRDYIRTNNPVWKNFVHPDAQALVSSIPSLINTEVQ